MMKKWNIFYIISAILLVVIVFIFFWDYSPKETHETEIHFLEVPIGNCTLIKTKQKNILIGEASEKDSKYIKEYLKIHKVNTISEIIVSSPAKDKIKGFDILLEDFKVEQIYLPHITDIDTVTNEFLNNAKSKEVSIYKVENKEEWEVGEMKLLFLRPSLDTTIPINKRKTIIKILLPKKSILLLPTMDKIDKIDLMLSSKQLKSDILKVNGKGREELLTEDFLEAINPSLIIFGDDSNLREKESRAIYGWNPDTNILTVDDEGYIAIYGEKGNYKITTRRMTNIRVQ